MPSTLRLDLFPTLGIDPGSAQAALCLRSGRRVLDASTLLRRLVAPAEDAYADQAWVAAVLDRADQVLAAHADTLTADAARHGVTAEPGTLPVRIAVRGVELPPQWRLKQRGSLIKDQAVHASRALALTWALCAAWPGTVLVPGSSEALANAWQPKHGGTGIKAGYFPPELGATRAARPKTWFPNDADKGERRYEQAAYQTAGLAHLIATAPDVDEHAEEVPA